MATKRATLEQSPRLFYTIIYDRRRESKQGSGRGGQGRLTLYCPETPGVRPLLSIDRPSKESQRERDEGSISRMNASFPGSAGDRWMKGREQEDERQQGEMG